MTDEKDREFRKKLNKARAHLGTATTQTQVPHEYRQHSIAELRAFLESLDPDNEDRAYSIIPRPTKDELERLKQRAALIGQ